MDEPQNLLVALLIQGCYISILGGSIVVVAILGYLAITRLLRAILRPRDRHRGQK